MWQPHWFGLPSRANLDSTKKEVQTPFQEQALAYLPVVRH